MKLFEELVEKVGWYPDFVMILNTPVDECFRRMRLRNRTCESSVDISYLQDLSDEYQKIKKTHTLNYDNSIIDIANRILTLLD
jgi:deoxyadenosine/deoxycytidine kinase